MLSVFCEQRRSPAFQKLNPNGRTLNGGFQTAIFIFIRIHLPLSLVKKIILAFAIIDFIFHKFSRG
jgi:hypothetical protein